MRLQRFRKRPSLFHERHPGIGTAPNGPLRITSDDCRQNHQRLGQHQGHPQERQDDGCQKHSHRLFEVKYKLIVVISMTKH